MARPLDRVVPPVLDHSGIRDGPARFVHNRNRKSRHNLCGERDEYQNKCNQPELYGRAEPSPEILDDASANHGATLGLLWFPRQDVYPLDEIRPPEDFEEFLSNL
jgi:hypothetical protein